MLTLGINYESHDTAAAIARDGEILFRNRGGAAQPQEAMMEASRCTR